MELDRSNKAVIHQLAFAEVKDRLPAGMDEAGWHAVRPNLGAVAEAGEWLRLVTGPITQPEFSGDERAYLAEAARLLAWGDDPWHSYTGSLKESTGRKEIGRANVRIPVDNCQRVCTH